MSLASIALVAAAFAGTPEKLEPPFKVGETINIELRDFDGNLLSLKDEKLKDKVILVDLWGTWCTPCWVAMPFMIDMQNKYRDAGLQIISVALEEGDTPEARSVKVRDTIKKKGINYPVLDGGGNDIEKVFALLPTIRKDFNTPCMILLDPERKVVYSHSGYNPVEKQDIEDQIKAALKHE